MSNETLPRVVGCLAAVTRYPTQLLTVDADLANDLGIDSVKRVEVVIALGEEFGIDLQSEPDQPSIRTIGDVVSWIEGLKDRNGATPARAETPAVAETPIVPETSAPPELPSNGRYRQDAAPAAGTQSVPPPHFPASSAGDDGSPSLKSLEGRVALVTGSGHGIGRTIARVLAGRGATVVVNSFHSREQGEQTAAEIQAQGGSAVHLWGSVANPDHVERIFDEIEQQFGYLDILVCNASDGKIGSFLELTWEDWERAFRTNVSGHHRCAVRSADLMRPRGGGSIVTMSAVGAHGFINGLGSQGVVKAAVETLTRYLACELGRYGIRVNCVGGGPVYGDLLGEFPSADAAQHHWESMTPDGELSSPMDLAETIAFLVSDQARGINGAIWMVDHGFSANADGQPLQGTPRRISLAVSH